MDATTIFKGSTKEAEIIRAALKFYADEVQRRTHKLVAPVELKVPGGIPMDCIRIARQLVRDIER